MKYALHLKKDNYNTACGLTTLNVTEDLNEMCCYNCSRTKFYAKKRNKFYFEQQLKSTVYQLIQAYDSLEKEYNK